MVRPMRKLLAVLALSIAALLGTSSPAWAAQANVTGCNGYELWEDGIEVRYTNPTINTTVYVRLTNGNLYAQPAWNTYVSTGVWIARVFKPSTTVQPERVILTATSISYARCANV